MRRKNNREKEVKKKSRDEVELKLGGKNNKNKINIIQLNERGLRVIAGTKLIHERIMGYVPVNYRLISTTLLTAVTYATLSETHYREPFTSPRLVVITSL